MYLNQYRVMSALYDFFLLEVWTKDIEISDFSNCLLQSENVYDSNMFSLMTLRFRLVIRVMILIMILFVSVNT